MAACSSMQPGPGAVVEDFVANILSDVFSVELAKSGYSCRQHCR